MKELVELNNINAAAIFSGNGIDELLLKIKVEAESFVPDLSTVSSRKEIASVSRQVSRSKVLIDDAGKELVAEWKSKSKLVDKSRKDARDFLDNLRDEIRKPLTDWEAEQKEAEQKEAELKELITAFDEAIKLNSLFDREKEIAEKERLIVEREIAENQKIAAEIAEKNRIKREEAMKLKAANDARLKAEQAAHDAIEAERTKAIKAKLNAEREVNEAIEREARLKAETELAAKKAEYDRIEALKVAEIAKKQAANDAKIKAENEALKLRNELIIAEKKEAARIAEIKARKDALAARRGHRRNINSKAQTDFVANGLDKEIAKDVIIMIANGLIENITINY